MSKNQDLKPFKDVTDLLAKVEIDGAAAKDRIYNRLIHKMETGAIQPDFSQKDGMYMKKNKWKSIAVSAAAIIVICGAFSTTSYAQDMLQSILAKFQVGNMVITQYDKLPEVVVKSNDGAKQADRSGEIKRETPKNMTLAEARTAMGINFPAPAWLAENYKYVNSVIHSGQMVEVQYEKDGEFISLLISKEVKNGISTKDGVKTETIAGTTVYFANGIVIWEHEGFTFELYQMAENSFDTETIGKIIHTL